MTGVAGAVAVTRVVVPFTVEVGGGWGQAGNRITIDARKALREAGAPGAIMRSTVHVNPEGLEPPVAGTTRVIVNGVSVKPCVETELTPASTYEVVVEKTGFGWIGGFTASGQLVLHVVGGDGGSVAVPAERAKPASDVVRDFLKVFSDASPLVLAVVILMLVVVILLLRR